MNDEHEVYFIGIDPGATGAVGVVKWDGSYHHVYPMPKSHIDFFDLILEIVTGLEGKVIITVEDVHAFPTDGKVSAFTFGRNIGRIEGALSALRSQYGVGWTFVSPQSWKRHHGLLKASKEDSVNLANEKWSLGLRKSHHGRAEALLLADYIRSEG